MKAVLHLIIFFVSLTDGGPLAKHSYLSIVSPSSQCRLTTHKLNWFTRRLMICRFLFDDVWYLHSGLLLGKRELARGYLRLCPPTWTQLWNLGRSILSSRRVTSLDYLSAGGRISSMGMSYFLFSISHLFCNWIRVSNMCFLFWNVCTAETVQNSDHPSQMCSENSKNTAQTFSRTLILKPNET